MGVYLLNSVCEGHFDCNDLLSSITGSIFVSLIYVCVCIDAPKSVHVTIFFYNFLRTDGA